MLWSGIRRSSQAIRSCGGGGPVRDARAAPAYSRSLLSLRLNVSLVVCVARLRRNGAIGGKSIGGSRVRLHNE